MSVSQVNFKSLDNITEKKDNKTVYTKTEPYPNDSVELSTQKNKEKKSAIKSWATGIGGSIAALAITGILFAKHQNSKISKLYKDKLVLSNLPEKLEFKEAKTIEEGIKFAKEILGIKEIDKDFTLEAINTANRGLVDVSNANKGKLFMPTRLGFRTPNNKNDDYLAYVVKDIESPNFGNLVINKNYFDNNILDKEIKDLLYANDGRAFYGFDHKTGDMSTILELGCVRPIPSDDLAKLIDKFYKDSSQLSISDKQTLFYSLQLGGDSALMTTRNPLWSLKYLQEKKSDVLKSNNINLNIDEVKNLTTEKQVEYLKDIVKKLEQKGSHWVWYYEKESPATVIHHEMGHLQDFAKNLKDLDLKKWKFSWKETWNDVRNNVKDRTRVEEVDNRWGTIWKEKYEKLLKEKPKKFQKSYPELYEFVTNQEIQQTAGKISTYAQSGIGEFIAETYARMIGGKKIPDDVMALYKRYKGPELP